MEAELEMQQLHNHEVMRKVKKNDRKFKDLAFIAEEEKKNQIRLESTIDELNNKIKSLRCQLEETEQASSLNLSKYRRAQLDLDNANMRAEQAESQLQSMKSKNRMSAQV